MGAARLSMRTVALVLNDGFNLDSPKEDEVERSNTQTSLSSNFLGEYLERITPLLLRKQTLSTPQYSRASKQGLP